MGKKKTNFSDIFSLTGKKKQRKTVHKKKRKQKKKLTKKSIANFKISTK